MTETANPLPAVTGNGPPDHQSRAHSDHGASSAKRWMSCPGSVKLCKGIPKTTSVYAEEGTAAHELAEMCIKQNRDAIEFIDRTVHGFVVDEAMAEHVQVYVDWVRQLQKDHPTGRLVIEQRVDLSALKPAAPMFGTNDAGMVAPDDGILIVGDLKYGAGVAVEAYQNAQGLYYLLGSLLALTPAERGRIKRCRIVIIQPRAYHVDGPIRTYDLGIDELIAWAKKLLKAVEETLQPNAALNSGSHCKFCAAAGVCPALARTALSLAQSEFDDVVDIETAIRNPVLPVTAELTPDQIGQILERADVFEGWISSVRAHALARLERGEPVPGYKLVAKRATRDWKNESVTDILDLDFGLPSSEIWERKVRTPAQIEKTVGKKAFKALEPYVVKESSGNTIAPESDKRPAVQAITAASEFDTLSSPDSDIYPA